MNLQIEEKERFEITDLNSLNWVFREILNPLYSKIEANKALAKTEIERVNEWLNETNKSSLKDVEYWEQRIQDFHFHTLLNDPKAKTLSTPYGKSKSRASKAQPEQVDKNAVLEHVLTNDMRDFVKEEVNWADFKKSLSIAEKDGVLVAVDGNGSVVEGVIIKPDSVSFKVEVN